MLTRPQPSARKIMLYSVLCGLLVTLLVAGLQSFYQHARREQHYSVMLKDLRAHLNDYFLELKATADGIQPLAASPCETLASELTSRSAFRVNVRAFLLVKDNIAYCSSATSSLSLKMHNIVPDLDTRKKVDVSLLSGTPMLPNKPAIAVWFSNPLLSGYGVFATLNVNLMPYQLYSSRERETIAIAIAVGDKALTSFSTAVVPIKDLPKNVVGSQRITHYPVTIYLFGELWPSQDILVAVLLGLFAGTVSGLACVWLIATHLRSDREILTGIKRKQFHLVWQPVVDAKTLQIKGAEALMRWEHRQSGTIPPDAFISYAEAQNLIVPLTRHLFSLIALDAPVLCDAMPPGSKIGINIAPGHLHSEGFKDDVRQLLSELPWGYFQVVFEITERDMVHEAQALPLFAWIHEQGIEIAVDDFGTGRSALIYLERFTLDYLKIDRGFILAIGQETVTSPVLDAVLSLAKKLDMTTVAEGVETREQANWLRARGVDYLQGYLYSYPLPVAELVSWSRGHRPETPVP